jgi:hypothetical protein
MKQRMKLFWGLKAGLLAVMFAAALPASAVPPVVDPTPSVPQVPRSIFTMPSNSKEGRDPFFPSSLRPYEGVRVPGGPTSDFSALVMQGISGAPPHQLVIINNVTFGVGDDAEVRTPQGRIRIHCVEIKGNSVMVEANGVEQTLHYGDKQ